MQCSSCRCMHHIHGSTLHLMMILFFLNCANFTHFGRHILTDYRANRHKFRLWRPGYTPKTKIITKCRPHFPHEPLLFVIQCADTITVGQVWSLNSYIDYLFSSLASILFPDRRMEQPSPDKYLAETDLACLKEAFALFDNDRDGQISIAELGKVINSTYIICL